MAANKKYSLKKILSVSVWIILASGLVVLLVAAMNKKNLEYLKDVDIKISGVQNNYFIDKKEVLKILEKVNGEKLDKSTISSLDLTAMEHALEKSEWIKRAELFFDNNKVLQVKITEREPIARLFTASGASFYIDSSLTRLSLSDKFSARLPVFTSFPTDVRVLKKRDSALLTQVKILGVYINTHPFWMAQIDQIDITPEGNFDLIPKLGNQVIRFGDASDYRQKFNKLLAFYKQVESKVGWNKYSVLDIQYKNQVVGVARDAAEIKSDSLKAVEIMKEIIAEAEKNSNDSTKIQLPEPKDNNDKINQSPVLDPVTDETSGANKTNPGDKKLDPKTSIAVGEKSIIRTQLRKESKAVIRRSSSVEKPHPDNTEKSKNRKPNETPKRVPKAVMPPKSDY